MVRQVSKIIFNENTLDKVLEEYNRFAAEVKDTSALVAKYEEKIKDIESQIVNLINAVAATGNYNESLQNKINDLEAQKKKLIEIIAQEKKAVAYLPATKDELRKVYKKAQETLLNGSFDEKKTVLQMFLNKILIFPKSVEIYVNLIPLSHLSGIDLIITPDDILEKLSPADPENGENTSK